MTAGRPRIVKTPEDLQNKVDEYFKLIDESGKPPTASGLARFCGFLSRQSIYDYAELSEEFSYTVKEALLRIEEFAESRLYSQSPTGAIFWLKNKGWKDRSEIEHSGDPEKPVTVAVALLPCTASVDEWDLMTGIDPDDEKH